MDNGKLKRLLVGGLSLKRLIRSSFLVAFLVYVGLFVYMHFYGNKIIFQPPPSSYRDTSEVIKLRSGEAQISAVYLKKPSRDVHNHLQPR